MNANLYSLMSLVGLKLASIAVPLYSMLYLFLRGDIEKLGYYSSITAILAPVAMFSSFRYIEHISSSADKEKAFIESIASSIIIFFICGLFALIIFVKKSYTHLIFWPWVIFFFKLLELGNDILIAQLASSNKIRKCFIISTFKFLMVVGFSLLFILFDLEPLIGLSVALFCGYAFGFVIFDFPMLINLKIHEKFDLNSIVKYIRSNVRFGVLNLLISLNSVVPRYFFIWTGDFRNLGMFTFLYQLSATGTNIVQYVFSIKSLALARFLQNHAAIFKYFLIFLIGLSAVIFSSTFCGLDSSFLPKPHIFVPIMTAAMLVRGLYITVRVIEGSFPLNRIQLIAIFFSTGLALVLFFLSPRYLYIPYFYVVLSSLITTSLVARRSKRL